MNIQIYGSKEKKKHKVNRRKKIAGTIIAITLLNPFTLKVAGDTMDLYRDDEVNNVNPIEEPIEYDYEYDQQNNSVTEEEQQQNYEYDDSKTYADSNRKPNNNKLFMSETEDAIFDTYKDENTAQYVYEKYYQTDKAIEKETNYKPRNSEHSKKMELVNGKFDANIIHETLRKNNKKYLEELPSYSLNKNSYEELTESELEFVSQTIATSLNYEIDNNKYLDIDEVRCVMANLKVYNSAGTGNAYVDAESGCMILSPNMIEVNGVINNKGEDNLEDVITHESKHLCQIPCKDNYTEDYTVLGISKEWKELAVNPLAWRWFYEGSAEKTMMNQTGRGAITYDFLVSYIDSLNMSTILNDNSDITAEEIGLQPNSQLLYDKFNCKSEQDKKEIINMMYSIDIIQYGKEDFYNQIGELSENEINVLDRKLKKGICETLTINFYDELSNRLKTENMKTDDIFNIIRVFEGDINSHLKCENPERYEQNKDFMNFYIKFQDNFFECLAISNDISPEELKQDFLSYIPQDNYKYESLNEKQNKFINKRYNDTKDAAAKSIKEISLNYKDTKKTK